MVASLRIAIVGYGIAGTAAAIQLHALGNSVEHFERGPAPDARGAGLILHPRSLIQLDTLGVLETALALGSPISNLRGETISGRRVLDFRYSDAATQVSALGIQRQTLFDLLQRRNPGREQIRWQRCITNVDTVQGVLTDSEGLRYGPYDLIVAADGAGSGLRRGLPAMVRHDRKSPWSAAVLLANDPNRAPGSMLIQRFRGIDHVSWWPVGRSHIGAHHRIAIAIKLRRSCVPSDNLRGALISQVRAFCPELDDCLAASGADAPILHYRYRDTQLRSAVQGRLVFIGDAAHCMSPQLGLGICLAMEDATALADTLKANTTVATALDEYDRRRKPIGVRTQRLSRWMTPLFQSDSRWLALLRDRGFPALSSTRFAQARMRDLLVANAICR